MIAPAMLGKCVKCSKPFGALDAASGDGLCSLCRPADLSDFTIVGFAAGVAVAFEKTDANRTAEKIARTLRESGLDVQLLPPRSSA